MRALRRLLLASMLLLAALASAQTAERVVDLPTRPGVTQRMLVIEPAQPKAAVVVFAGGHGGLRIFPNGSMQWGEGNFLVRSRRLFAEQGLLLAVIDTPSDRQTLPFLNGFRQTSQHAADIKATIAWLRAAAKVPVWLVGTSRGTQSAAYVSIELSGDEGPDGVVLTSSILSDPRSRAVPAMPLERLKIPTLVVHHEKDGCSLCRFSDVQLLMSKLTSTPKAHLITFTDGRDVGDPCDAFAYHGFNGIEPTVVQQIARWILTP